MFTVISDVHVSLKNLDVSINVLRQVLELSRQLKIPSFWAGDINDTKAILRSECVKSLLDLCLEFNDVQIYILIGNHDLNNKHADDHSLEFLKSLPNIKLINTAQSLDLIPTFKAIPYQTTKENFLKEIDVARSEGYKRLLCHQGFLGAFLGDYLVDDSSVDPMLLKDFEFIGSGHYHKTQRVLDNILYWGSPYTTNVSEADQEKFIWVVEEINGILVQKPYQTSVRRHYKAVIESDEDIKALSPKPNSIAHIVLKGPKEFIKKHNNVDKFKKILNAQSVVIIPEIDRQSEHRISAEILHSPLKVIDVYLEKADTILNKDILKDYLFKTTEELLTTFTSNTSKTFKVKKAEAKNFLSFKELSFTYSAMGLTLVEGFDEDKGLSPGSGKSSFFDVVLYGLFGQTSKDIKADEVINRIAKKNCEVLITLQADDGEYLLKRYRKHSEYDNDLVLVFPNGKELRGKDNKETQKLIEQEIGHSYELFLKSSYFTQFGAIDRFLSASDTEKKKLISDITDLSIYDELLIKIKNNIKDNQELLNIEERTLISSQTRFDSLKHFLSEDINNKNQWDLKKETDLQIANGKKSNWELNQDSLIFDTKQFALNFSNEIDEQIKKLEEEKQVFELNKTASINFKNNKIIEIEKEREKITSEIIELNQRLNSFSNIDEEVILLDKKLKAIADLNTLKNKNEIELLNINKQVSLLNNKIAEEAKKWEENKNGTCFHCHQSISPSMIESVINNYKEQISKLEETKGPLLSKIAEIEPFLNMKAEVESKKSELLNQKFTIKSIWDVIGSKDNQILLLARNIDSLKNEIANLEVSKSDANYKIEIVKQKQNPHLNKLAELEKEINPYNKEIEIITSSVNPYLTSIENKQNDLASLEKTLDDQILKVNFIKQELTYGEFWKQALHVYIKSYLMDSCLDQLNDLTNEYLNTLFDGILQFNISAITESGKDIKEKISVSIINNGDECSYQSLSGGERCRICLALNLALSQVIMKSNGKNFGVIFLDEILNGLDETGKTQTMRLLKELELQYESVFIIDHSTEFKALFTNSIMIKKKDKISYIV